MRKLVATPGARALLALVALNVLLELPVGVQPDGFDAHAVRVSGDLLLLLSVWAGTRGASPGIRAWVRALLAGVAAVLVFYRLDEAVCLVLMRHRPVLYDQWFLLRHLGVLLSDLWGAWIVAAAIGLVLFVVGASRVVRKLLGVIAVALPPELSPRIVQVACALWVLILLPSFLQRGQDIDSQAVHWVLPRIARSVGRSYRLQASIERGLRASPYHGYAALRLRRKPRVLFFFVESYGRAAVKDPATRDIWQRVTTRTERDLGAAGWHFASAYSEAPVSGGRSWLAHASVFTGIRVSYQALFQRMTAGDHMQVPNLVGFLRAQGYRTALLAPADRERPGVTVDNPYGYERTLSFSKLGYAGPYFGWGRIPDQYSLSVADERVLRATPGPVFLAFTMVTSHAPWKQLPKLTAAARDLDAYAAQHRAFATEPPEKKKLGQGTIPSHVERYEHEQPMVTAKPASGSVRSAYAYSIAYDLELIRRQLLGMTDDALVFVMGDHQPPLVTGAAEDYAVPVHVFARDPALLQEFLAHGFVPTLGLGPDAPAAAVHEGLFSLIVRDLARASGSEQTWPPYLPTGVRLEEQ